MNSGEIIALGSGRNLIGYRDHPLHQYILDLSKKETPMVGFLPTATGDSSEYIVSFYQTYNQYRCQPSHLPLFAREAGDLRPWFESQDIIYVGGGNTANMLAVWRLHGVDLLLRDFLKKGKILWGGSAGGLCWFKGGVTDSFGALDLAPWTDGLGFLSGSFCPHFDSDPKRQPLYTKAIREGILPPGYGVDDFAALHFSAGQLQKSLCLVPGAGAYRVDTSGEQEALRLEDLFQG